MPADPHQDILDSLGILPTDEDTLTAPSPLYREMTQTAPGQVRSAASNLLGITDALRALRGEMTPEEAKMFALGALPGLIPGGKGGTLAEKAAGAAVKMKDLPFEMMHSVYGEMTPQEVVSKLGGPQQFGQKYPALHNALTPYLPEEMKAPGAIVPAGKVPDEFDALTAQYKNWTEKEGLPYKSMDEHDPDTLTSMQKLSLAGFKKKWDSLLANKLLGQLGEIMGPSSTLASKPAGSKPSNPLAIATFPREIPFGVPPRAQQLGFTTPAVHGTGGTAWEGPPDQLRLPDEQLGVHFGNPKQAATFATRTTPSTWAEPRTFPVVLQAQNPLEMRDMGSWYKEDIIRALNQINEGRHTEVLDRTLTPEAHAEGAWYSPPGGRQLAPEAKGLFPLHELDKLNDIEDVRDYIASKGYDSIKYINAVEDAGSPSYIMFQPSPTNPKFVMGARSPFAQFDPSKLHLPSLAAGLGALTLYPFRGDEERGGNQ